MRKQLSVSLASLLFLLCTGFTLETATAAPAKPSAESKASSEAKPAATEKATPEKAETNPNQKLHRADFRVGGASCVACLRRVGKLMREQKGVLKADVSIFKPYWAIVIYDADKINMEKITESVKSEKVNFQDIEDKAIASLPLIIIPKSGTTPGAPANPSTN